MLQVKHNGKFQGYPKKSAIKNFNLSDHLSHLYQDTGGNIYGKKVLMINYVKMRKRFWKWRKDYAYYEIDMTLIGINP